MLPAGVYKGDLLIVDLDELATAPPCTQSRVYHLKEVRVPEIGTAFPLRVAHSRTCLGSLYTCILDPQLASGSAAREITAGLVPRDRTGRHIDRQSYRGLLGLNVVLYTEIRL